jgi:hypothetical protein
MRCTICSHPERVAINKLLLERAGPRAGVTSALAERLGVTRQVVWNHRKNHLGMNTARVKPNEDGKKTLEQRAAELGQEADRLQLAAEHGMEAAQFDRAMRALSLRMRLLEMEGRLAGRLRGGKAKLVTAADLGGALSEAAAEAAREFDPEEAARVEREYAEVCGPEAER